MNNQQNNILTPNETIEEAIYAKKYHFIKGYATGLGLVSTLKALPLCVITHRGQYRKTTTEFLGQTYHTPYCMHCLDVCSTLISLHLPLSEEELDIMLAGALLHDTLEDQADKFPAGGQEFITVYGIHPRVLDIVRLLTKRSGATEEELEQYFENIRHDKLAIMIKCADRSHNSSSLYVMKYKKLLKYVEETRRHIYPTISYGKMHYPEFSNGLTILKSKIKSLIDTTEVLLSKIQTEETHTEVADNSTEGKP